MIEIKDLLSRWSKILSSEESQAETIREIISSVVGVDIKSGDIKIKKDTVFLNIKPIYKNEIFLKRDKIDVLLEQAFGVRSPQDIR